MPIQYKRYCWAIGTTSYRTENFNLSIEKQLQLMSNFRLIPEHIGKEWRELQTGYYYYLKNNKFVQGDAGRPDKDAREKTSGLVEIGLMNNERQLTEAGKAILELSLEGRYGKDNELQISNDSYIYLKQLIKTSNEIDGQFVRPFIVFLFAISKLGYLTSDEFAYLLPLSITRDRTDTIIEKIKQYRLGNDTLDNIIYSVIQSMDNYSQAYDLLCNIDMSEELICTVGMNRKSRNYDKAYYPFYNELKRVVIDRDEERVAKLFEATKKLSGNPAHLWMEYLFATSNKRIILRDKIAALNRTEIIAAQNEAELKNIFFKFMHLFKMKSTLRDYFDLNRRYFKITDTVIFKDNRIELDVLPKLYFDRIADELINIGFEAADKLETNCRIEEISHHLAIDERRLFQELESKYGIAVRTGEDARKIIKDERYSRFNRLIDEKFSIDNLIGLLSLFESRDDDKIKAAITDNADVPTLFEYVLGIIWYLISNKEGDILDYMKLSLEADLLPKTHALGGNADIIYSYAETNDYPEHCLLIEATLCDGTAQRRMEGEPVARHLGEHILETGKTNSYSLFISTYLDRNIVSGFRNQMTLQYLSQDGVRPVNGLKILPLKTSELKSILASGKKYSDLYSDFENAYRSNEPVPTWYEHEIKRRYG